MGVFPRVMFGTAIVAMVLLLLIRLADSNRRRGDARRNDMLDEAAASPRQVVAEATSAPPGNEEMRQLLHGCGRLFLDGGSNTGESVRAFMSGGFYTCGLHSPFRQYSSRWASMSRWQRGAAMQPLREPSTFCIRSFEAAPELLPGLREQETALRARGANIRFVDGTLSNETSADAPRTIVRYAKNRWGSSAVGLEFGDVHVGGKPVALSTRTIRGQSYDVRALIRTAMSLNSSSVVALKLDLEGGEWRVLEALTSDTQLLCSLSYIFVEFHSTASATQRAKLATYGYREDLFEALKQRVHAAMETPRCRLQVYWRSFWASCGDKQRFEWRTSAQATADSFEVT